MDLSVQPLQNQGNISSVGALGSQTPLAVDSSNQGVDKQALNLTRAIALAESGSKGKPNYNAVGDNGTSFGAYQWNGAEKFAAKAKMFGLNPSDFSPENQDKVAYAEIKSWKDAGLQPAEIASKWNSGGENNYQDHSGTTVINGKTISYDTPAYVQKVKANYQTLSNQDSQQNSQTGFNPKPFSNPESGQAIGQDKLTNDKSSQPGYNQDQGVVKNIANYDIGVGKSVGQLLPGLLTLGGKIGNFAQGKGFQQEVQPGSLIDRMNYALSPSNKMQAAGNMVGDVGQFFVGSGEEKVLSKLPELGKYGTLAAKGLIRAGESSALTQAQGGQNQSDVNRNSAIVGGISATSPFIGELVGKAMPAVKDFFGGAGTADALKVKNATPELVNAWQKGTRTISSLADTITETAKNYETQGKKAFNAVIDNLPDIKMPQNFVEGGIRKSLQDLMDSSPNLLPQEEKTLANLQKYVSNADIKGVKGIENLRQGIDNGGFYRTGDPAFNNSNKIVNTFRNTLNETAISQAGHYDALNGTKTAEELKQALADATDRIKFMDKFKANLIGTNPDTYVERTVNKVKTLINKFGNPADYENTKDLLTDFEQRIGHPGLFQKDFQAANAAKTLEGLTGRVLTKAGLGLGLEELASGGGIIKTVKKGFNALNGH